MKKYKVVIEGKDGDIRRIVKTKKDLAVKVSEKYCWDYRVMINELDEEYGTCNNIFDNKDLIDEFNNVEKELWGIINDN